MGNFMGGYKGKVRRRGRSIYVGGCERKVFCKGQDNVGKVVGEEEGWGISFLLPSDGDWGLELSIRLHHIREIALSFSSEFFVYSFVIAFITAAKVVES